MSSDSEKEQISVFRSRIDQIDQQIGELISERAKCAQQVAEIKKAHSDGEIVFYRPEREAQVLRKAMERNQGPLQDEEIARLFREIMSACLALEQPTKVAYLGPEGTFTEQAALKHFGHSAVTIAFPAIDQIFREVESGATRYGVVPIENSTEGVVNHTLDSFRDSNMKICGEVVLRIHQHLLVAEGTQAEQIATIYSHAQSLAQCRKWLDANFPGAERIAVSSNAEAARCVGDRTDVAAIAGVMAAKRYDLKMIAERIEDRPDNSTRFLIIGTEVVQQSGDDKSSVMIAMRNEPGALHDLLEPFHRHKIDLTRVETRPSRSGNWSYVFFIDFAGHVADPHVRTVLDEVGKRAADLKILGSYPIGVL